MSIRWAVLEGSGKRAAHAFRKVEGLEQSACRKARVMHALLIFVNPDQAPRCRACVQALKGMEDDARAPADRVD